MHFSKFIFPFYQDRIGKILIELNIGIMTLLNKLSKTTKYQRQEFIDEHKLDEVDITISALDPNKHQFKILTEVIHAKEENMKAQLEKGVELLCKAKDIFIKNSFDLYVVKRFVGDSGIFNDRQMIKSFIEEYTQPKPKVPFTELWNLDKKVVSLSYDPINDEVLGKIAKKYLPKFRSQSLKELKRDLSKETTYQYTSFTPNFSCENLT